MLINSVVVAKIIEVLWGLRKKSMVVIIVTLVAIVAALISIKYLKPDNPVEEISEEVIKYFDNVDINFSPDQQEPPNASK